MKDVNGMKCAGDMDIESQVRVVIGVVVIITVLLAYLFSAYFLWLTLIVGAALIYSGFVGCCKLREFLLKMPWNKNKGL